MHANVCAAIVLNFSFSQLGAADSFRGEKLIKGIRMRTLAWVHFIPLESCLGLTLLKMKNLKEADCHFRSLCCLQGELQMQLKH